MIGGESNSQGNPNPTPVHPGCMACVVPNAELVWAGNHHMVRGSVSPYHCCAKACPMGYPAQDMAGTVAAFPSALGQFSLCLLSPAQKCHLSASSLPSPIPVLHSARLPMPASAGAGSRASRLACILVPALLALE